MKFLVAFLLVLVYCKVDAATDGDLARIRDSSVLAYGNLESGAYYLEERQYRQQVTDAVTALSTLNSLATIALPPYSYPVYEEIVYYDGHQSLTNIVSILQTYAPGAPVDVREYLENAYRYTIDTQQALRNLANP
ncbi:hypothetical protein HA402_008325 [Bradysia odoriphaga]|nr:hypothetical protein HA402_008325 [Bradysia odoriphaga]